MEESTSLFDSNCHENFTTHLIVGTYSECIDAIAADRPERCGYALAHGGCDRQRL